MLSLNINDYFKEIGQYKGGRPRLAVDYEKLIATPFNFFLIITEREVRVKTFGAKELLFNKWKRTKASGLWLRTLADDADDELATFFSDVPEALDLEEFRFKKDIAYSKNNEPFLMLSSVARPSRIRGSRMLVDYVIWDEFNLGVSGKNYKSIVDNWTDILKSTSNNNTVRHQKSFLLGNNKSFNHPLLVSLGITHLDREVTPIYSEEGFPILLIIFPIISEEEKAAIRQENKDNPLYLLMDRLGVAEHSFFNANQYDEVNSIYTPATLDDLVYWPKLSFRSTSGVVRCYAVKKGSGNVFLFINDTFLKNKYKVKLDDHPMLSKKPQLKNGDRIIDNMQKDIFMLLLSENKVVFSDLATKSFYYDTFK